MVEADDFISREELLKGGLPPGQRASALLFAIESQTAYLVTQAQQATAFYLTKKAVEEREIEYLDAYASGRHLHATVRIQDLERYAPNWSNIVTEIDKSLKAALAIALGNKYIFNAKQIPNIRTALGLDSDEVIDTFQQLYGKPITSIYSTTIPWNERFRWNVSLLWNWLEGLPPFLVAFIITIPLGSGLLAMPIALADVGPMVGIGLVIFFGLISALTTAALAEAVARSCNASFGLGYLGQLVLEYLGPYGSIFLTITLAIDSFLVLVIFYLGVADTLEAASSIPGVIWPFILFGGVLFFLSRKTLSSTVASTLVIGIVNVILLVIIPIFALPYLVPTFFSLSNIPLLNKVTINFSTVQMIFGVLLGSFSSHLLVGNYGRVILRRDPSARSWIWGCLASIGLAMLVSCLWIIAVNGTVSAEILAGQTGTALTVLEKLIGPIANWLGSAFIVLSLGLGCVHFSLGLFFLIDERIPLHSENKGAKRSHFILCAFPAIGAFLVAEWLLINNVGSFTGLLGFVGIMTLPLVAGVYPILLLASTRRKGDIVPGLVLKGIGNPIVLAGTYLLFIGSIFLHGLYAFQGVLEKTIILLVGCIVVVMTGIMLKQRALTSRLVIEIRQDLSGFQRVIFNLTAKGNPIVSDVRLDYGDRINDLHTAYDQIPDFFSLNLIRFRLPVIAVDEVKVWAHKISAQGKSEALPIQGSIQIADNLRRIDLSQNDGLEQFTVKKEPCNYEFQLWFTKKI